MSKASRHTSSTAKTPKTPKSTTRIVDGKITLSAADIDQLDRVIDRLIVAARALSAIADGDHELAATAAVVDGAAADLVDLLGDRGAKAVA